MYTISKLFTAWFLPPGLAITVLFLWAIALMKKERVGIGFLMLLFAASLYAACIGPVSDRLILPLENAYPQLNVKALSPHDVYVVLGGGIHDNAPELEGSGSLRGDSLQRLVYAFRLYRIQPLPVIVSSGRGFQCQRPEAPVMQRYLVQMGVPGKDISMDSESRNTYENALEVKKICEKLLCRHIVLITSAYHMKRALFAFKHAGMANILPAPTDYKTNRTCYGPIDYMPDMGALSNTYRALHEYIGMLYYRILAGT
ncbi:MAG: YdcF family protein [Deltaproteobacteria bacterium]|nr:YdcF family protein [Deltaproteobacteria bacterium]MCL5277213.1 YdcF family protein [Deltaproteobacteria bacterium]